MFCGECGRAVASKAAAKSRPRVPVNAASTPSRWPSLVAEHQIDPMVALSEQPGLVEVDLLASRPIAIPVAIAPEVIEPRVTPPAAESVPAPIPEILIAAELAKADRESAGRASADQQSADRPSADLEIADRAELDIADRTEYCLQCGAELAASDIFCGECGFVRRSADSAIARPRDTASYDPFPWGLPGPADDAPPAENALEVEDSLDAHVPVDADPQIDHEPARNDSVVQSDDSTGAEDSAGGDASTPGAPEAESFHAARGSLAEHSADSTDVEKTRIVDRAARGDAFILQFSTGENLTVSGTGLIGRNPLAEPGEYFDSLVSIVDPGKSVSKTHLEFGQDGGQFWISDRYSANGTVVREPDRPARRGEAGKRYRVVRGTRVDIGEQFFIVS